MRYLFFSFFVLLASCFPKQEDKPVVLVSIAPYAYFVEKIVGENLCVKTVVPQGVDTHTYEPTPKSLALLDKVDVWFRVGDPFERKLEVVLKEKNPDIKIYDLRAVVPLLPAEGHSHAHHTHEHAHSKKGHSCPRCSHCSSHRKQSSYVDKNDPFAGKDVHVWMNPKLALKQCAFIKKILEKMYPKLSLEASFSSLEKKLITLDSSLRSLLKDIPSRAFFTSHTSFAYFCEEYNLVQISFEANGKEALAKDAEKALRTAKKRGVAVALVEPQFSARSAKIAANYLDIPIKMVDPYSDRYEENLLRLAKILHDPSK